MTILLFQDDALRGARTRTRPSQTRGLRPSTQLLLKALGAGPTGRITYAAEGRLDGIGRRAIGDMGLLRCCAECRIERNATRTSGPAIIAGRRMAHKPVQVHAL